MLTPTIDLIDSMGANPMFDTCQKRTGLVLIRIPHVRVEDEETFQGLYRIDIGRHAIMIQTPIVRGLETCPRHASVMHWHIQTLTLQFNVATGREPVVMLFHGLHMHQKSVSFKHRRFTQQTFGSIDLRYHVVITQERH
jgi:hypothetical protein